jgi:PAS domain S-box-containing protein
MVVVLSVLFLIFTNHRLKVLVKEKVSQIDESNRRYELATSATFDGILDIDLTHQTCRMEGNFQELLGYKHPNNTMIGIPSDWDKIIDARDRDEIRAVLKDKLESEQSICTGIFRLHRDDHTTVWVELNMVIIRNTAGNAVRLVGAIRDISERVRYTHAIERQNAQLREIAWIQSHEIRGPLCRITAIISLLQDSEANDIATAGYIAMMEEAVNEIDAVIHRIVDKSDVLDLKSAKFID